MKLQFGNKVPGSIEEVYEYVTGVGSDGPLDHIMFEQKYGTLVSQSGQTIVTKVSDGDSETVWTSTFSYPNRRIIIMDPASSAREDTFARVKGGTKWTVIIHSETSGIQGLIQWLYFQIIGKYRVGVPILSPAIFHFRRIALDIGKASTKPPFEAPDTEGLDHFGQQNVVDEARGPEGDR